MSTVCVLVIAIRRITAADGNLHELTVQHQTTGAVGSYLVTATEGRELLGDCPTMDVIRVDPNRITWRE